SNLADAKLGLNIGKAMSVMVRGDRQIPVHCGALAFVFSNGIGKSKAMVLDTEQTYVEGGGTIDLRDQRFDLVLDPRPKRPGLLTLRSFIELHGSFRPGALHLDHRITREPSGGVSAGDADYASWAPL